MSMRTLAPIGWLMIGLGLVLGVGGIAAGQAVTGAILLVSLAGSGWFMIWLGKGWDKPLDDAAELYKYGRPANATVRKVDDAKLDGNGTRTEAGRRDSRSRATRPPPWRGSRQTGAPTAPHRARRDREAHGGCPAR